MAEFAFVLPLLVVLSLCVVDLGRACWLRTRLASAARGAAMHAQHSPSQVVAGPSCADPNNVVYVAQHEEGRQNSYRVEVANVSSGGAPITGCDTTTIGPGTLVAVEVSQPFRLVTPVLSLVVGRTPTLRATSEVVVTG